MAFWRTKKDGTHYRVDDDSGEVRTPIGTISLSTTTQHDSDKRLISRILGKSRGVKKSHDTKLFQERLRQQAQDKVDIKRKTRLEDVRALYEYNRELLRNAEKDPAILDKQKVEHFQKVN